MHGPLLPLLVACTSLVACAQRPAVPGSRGSPASPVPSTSPTRVGTGLIERADARNGELPALVVADGSTVKLVRNGSVDTMTSVDGRARLAIGNASGAVIVDHVAGSAPDAPGILSRLVGGRLTTIPTPAGMEVSLLDVATVGGRPKVLYPRSSTRHPATAGASRPGPSSSRTSLQTGA